MLCFNHVKAEEKTQAKQPKEWVLEDSDVRKKIPNRLPLCRELLEILKSPENKDYMRNENVYNPTFIIPKSFKDFRYPVWKDVPKEQWSELLFGIDERYVRDEDGVQSTLMDIDLDGTQDTIVQFQRGAVRCRVSIKSPDYLQDFNPDDHLGDTPCTLFWYKGKPYKVAGHGDLTLGYGELTIYKAKARSASYSIPVCNYNYLEIKH
jgi:hypothetical protein